MRIGLIASPFIAVPPARYGGTELFIANLARGVHARGHEVTVYANGDSRLPCRVKWRYPHARWPLEDPTEAVLMNLDHTAWAVRDAAEWADIVHLNDSVGIAFTQFTDRPTVMTLHHPHVDALTEHYCRYADVHYVAIAAWLAEREPMPRLQVVHHGIPIAEYTCTATKDDYVAFLGRIAPCKGPHLAIQAARLAGVRLKIAGEVQPAFHDYWAREVAPFIDGRHVEFVGPVDHVQKNELLSRARALLFPIQWEEPFGLVMIEAMACGTPVLAFAGGAVEEVVRNGVNGWICRDLVEMAERISSTLPSSADCHDYASTHFSEATMVGRYLSLYEQLLARDEQDDGFVELQTNTGSAPQVAPSAVGVHSRPVSDVAAAAVLAKIKPKLPDDTSSSVPST